MIFTTNDDIAPLYDAVPGTREHRIYGWVMGEATRRFTRIEWKYHEGTMYAMDRGELADIHGNRLAMKHGAYWVRNAQLDGTDKPWTKLCEMTDLPRLPK